MLPKQQRNLSGCCRNYIIESFLTAKSEDRAALQNHRMEDAAVMSAIHKFYIITFLYWFSLYVYMPILSPYVEHLGGSLSMVGLVVGSYGLVQLFLRVPMGITSDLMSNRRFFIGLGMALAGISAVGMGMAPSAPVVLGFRALSGGAATVWVAFTVLFSSYFASEDASKAMGLIVFLQSLGQMTASTLGGFSADLWGWRAPFFIAAGAALLGWAFVPAIAESKKVQRGPRVEIRSLLAVGKQPLVLIVSFLAVLLQWLTFSTVFGFTPSYAVSIGASNSELSILALVSSLPAALTALRCGHWAEKYGDRQVLAAGFILFGLGAFLIPRSGTMLLLYLTQAVGAMGRGAVFPLLMGLSISDISNDKRATAMGFFQSIYALGMFAGPALTGVISESLGLHRGFDIVALVGAGAAVMTFAVLHRAKAASQ